MRYPFAILGGTLAVFAFVGVMLAGGDLRFGEDTTPPSHISVEQATLQCAQLEDDPARDVLHLIGERCNNQSSCAPATLTFPDSDIACTRELSIHYRCDPGSDTTMQITFYEQQPDPLRCDGG